MKKYEFSGNAKRTYHRIWINASDLFPDAFILTAPGDDRVLWKGEPL